MKLPLATSLYLHCGIAIAMLATTTSYTQAFSSPFAATTTTISRSRSRSSSSSIPSSFSFSLSSTKTATSPSTTSSTPPPETKTDCVVVGAGPAGILTAIMLSQKFPQKTIQVYDRLQPPPSPTDDEIWSDVAKFYLIGLGSRGQKALRQYGVWDDVERVCTTVVGRKDWAPESAKGSKGTKDSGGGNNDEGEEDDGGVERIFTDRPVMTQVLPRDKLVGVLHQHVKENYNDKIQLNYGYEIMPETFGDQSSSTMDENESENDDSSVIIRVSKCEGEEEDGNSKPRQMPASASTAVSSTTTDADTNINTNTDVLCDIDNSFTVKTDLLIAADGTSRTVANAMEQNDNKRWKALNPIQKLYAEKPFHVKRYVDDNKRVYKTIPMKVPDNWRGDLNYSARTKDGRINYDALPADTNGNYCGVLLIKETDEFAKADTDPKKLRLLLDDALPQFSKLLDDETVSEIAKKPVSYLPSFRYAGPRLNQGDRTILLGDCAHTVKPYFGLGANSALEDVQVLEDAIDATNDIPSAVHLFSKKRASESKSLVKISRELDRPGKLGLLTFLIPIILDGIFQKLLPKVFAPNTISMLQKEDITFSDVRRRKRMDRLGQLAIIGTVLSGMALGVKCLIKNIAKAVSGNPKVGAGIAGAAFIALAGRAFTKFNPNMAPADVMPKKST